MTVLVGQTSSGTTTDFFTNGNTAAFPFVAAANGTAATIFADFQQANASLSTVKLGIYADSGAANPTGSPLAQATITPTPTSAGVFSGDISGAALSIVSGTTYWLAMGGTGESVDIKGTTSSAGKESQTGNLCTPWAGLGGMSVLPTIWVEDAATAPVLTESFQAIPFIPTTVR